MEIWIKHNINNTLINAWRSEISLGAYGYNLFGNQIRYTPDGVVYTNYTYRPDGLRHSIGDKVHIWDGTNIAADVEDNDVIVYIRGINLIYADDGNRTYYHFNAHGDVVALTNANGSKTKSYSYNAFGVEYNEATLDDNPFRYCGEYYDKETKTIYLRARYYNAAQGRFTQEDPIRDGLNWYAYCGGNPIMFVDSTGYYARSHCYSILTDRNLGGVTSENETNNAVVESEVNEGVSCGDIFGAEASKSVSYNEETPVFEIPLIPVSVSRGNSFSVIETIAGDSSKPISVYANKDLLHPMTSSSAGTQINISEFSIKSSLAIDHFGDSFSWDNGQKTISFYRNFKELTFVIEYSENYEYITEEGFKVIETSYTKIEVDLKFVIVVAYVLCTYDIATFLQWLVASSSASASVYVT